MTGNDQVAVDQVDLKEANSDANFSPCKEANSDANVSPAVSSAKSHRSRSKDLLRHKVKNAQLLLISGAKVDTDNKIGVVPEGWERELALALQRGITSEAASSQRLRQPSPDFEAAKPELFARVRAACGLLPPRYNSALGLQDGQTDPSLRVVGSSSASGKSGAFFLLSPDQQCIAKSCTEEDWNTLLRILPAYVQRMEDAREKAESSSNNGNNEWRDADRPTSGFIETLLPRYLGLYTLYNVGGKKSPVRILVMGNVFSGSRRIHRRYDLKGSTVGRKASAKELKKTAPVLKDLDWVRDEASLALGDNARTRILTALRDDVSFLKEWGLMDYSLLVGVHDRDEEDSRKREAMNVVYVQDSKRLGYLGIVDILTTYGWRKWTETLLLGKLSCGSDISCQHPRVYGDRFLRFAQEFVFQSYE